MPYPTCYRCEDPATEADQCKGCRAYICDDCEVCQPFGPHHPSDHYFDDEDDDGT